MVLPKLCTHRADRMPAEVRRSRSGTGQPCTPREQRPLRRQPRLARARASGLWSPHVGHLLFRGVPKVDVKKMLHANCKALYRLDHIPDTLP